MTIRLKLTMATIGVILVANSLLSLVGVQYLGRVWLREVQSRVRLDLNSARADYDSRVDGMARFLRGVSLNAAIGGAVERGDRAKLHELLQGAHEAGGMDFLSVLDANGTVLCRATDADRIEPRHLPAEVRQSAPQSALARLPETWEEFKRLKQQVRDAAVQELESRFLTEALLRCEGNVSKAAEDVGMQRTSFHALMRKYGLSAEGDS